jgi:hypothetical protein
MSLLGGLTFVNENYRGDDAGPGGRRESSGEGLVGLSLDKFQAGRLRFTGKTSVFPTSWNAAGFALLRAPECGCR